MPRQYTVEEMRKLPGMIRDDSDIPPTPKCKKGLEGHIVHIGHGFHCNHSFRVLTEEEVAEGTCHGCD